MMTDAELSSELKRIAIDALGWPSNNSFAALEGVKQVIRTIEAIGSTENFDELRLMLLHPSERPGRHD